MPSQPLQLEASFHFYRAVEKGACMYCRYCGAEVDEDSVFCASCGKQVEEPSGASDTVAQDGEAVPEVKKSSPAHKRKRKQFLES